MHHFRTLTPEADKTANLRDSAEQYGLVENIFGLPRHEDLSLTLLPVKLLAI